MQPSPLVGSVIATAERENMRGMRLAMQREAEFPSKLQAQLTGIALDPEAREFTNRLIDAEFQSNRLYGELPETTIPELIIGSGFHAATYAATRVLMGHPAPYIFERDDYAGGTFAVRSADGTYPAVFNLNSRNRRGTPGLSGDSEAQLNYLPGAPIQASSLSSAEYQSNADMAFIIRVALAQYVPKATFPGIEVLGIQANVDDFTVAYRRFDVQRTIRTRRVIDARGLGDSRNATEANGTNVLTFTQFLERMSGPWPLRGLRNVAVIGDGDSGKCAVEPLLGLGPNALMAPADLDTVNRVDWYGPNVASDYDTFCNGNRGRYRAIGRYLRPDRMGNQRLQVFNTRITSPLAFPGGPVLVNGRSYDLVILAAGNRVAGVPGLDWRDSDTSNVYLGDRRTRVIATTYGADYGGVYRYRVGPRANIPFDSDESEAGVSDISNNQVAMFRLATRTAALAIQLD